MSRPDTRLLLLIVVALLLFSGASAALAEDAAPLTAGEVISLSNEADGQTVVMEGEAIGDVLRSDAGRVWVNVLSGGSAIGVWAEREQADGIGELGRYKTRGDIVRVTGVFNAACDQHNGDRDVHALELVVTEPGGELDRPVRWWKYLAGFGLLAVAAAQTLLYRRRRSQTYTG